MSKYEFVSSADPVYVGKQSASRPTPEVHRETVTSLLCQAADDNEGRCLIMGAGSCRDINLPRLLSSFREVHLLDLDRQIVINGVAAQGLAGRPEVVIHAPVDVCGINDPIQHLELLNGDADLAHQSLLKMVAEHELPDISAPFHVVASTGLLSQLVAAIVANMPQTHDLFIPLIQAIRARHIALMTAQCRAGGRCLLIHDFVSSETIPELASLPVEQLQPRLLQAIEEKNFFHGMNPRIMHALLCGVEFKASIEHVQLSLPWIWMQGSVAYAVVAFQFQVRQHCVE